MVTFHSSDQLLRFLESILGYILHTLPLPFKYFHQTFTANNLFVLSDALQTHPKLKQPQDTQVGVVYGHVRKIIGPCREHNTSIIPTSQNPLRESQFAQHSR